MYSLDVHNAVWRASFMKPFVSSNRVGTLDIPEALAGQLTPPGLPVISGSKKIKKNIKCQGNHSYGRKKMKQRISKRLRRIKKKAGQREATPKEQEPEAADKTCVLKPSTSLISSRNGATRGEQRYLAMEKVFAQSMDLYEYCNDHTSYCNLRF